MGLTLINSQYKNIKEVEYLLRWDISEKEILKAKDNRRDIEILLSMAGTNQYIEELGI